MPLALSNPRGSLQMNMTTCPPGLLLAGIKFRIFKVGSVKYHMKKCGQAGNQFAAQIGYKIEEVIE